MVIDETMRTLGHAGHRLDGVFDAEVLTMAVVAAFFGNHHDRALTVLRATGYLSRALSPSRFSRHLHVLAGWLALLRTSRSDLFAHGQVLIADFIIGSTPTRSASACGPRTGAAGWYAGVLRVYCGYCLAKKEAFFDWRLHWVCTPASLPVAFTLLQGGFHDRTPIHELPLELPEKACVYGDKGFSSAPDEAVICATGGDVLVPLHKDNIVPHTRTERCGLRTFHLASETVNSQLTAMGLARLHVRSVASLE